MFPLNIILIKGRAVVLRGMVLVYLFEVGKESSEHRASILPVGCISLKEFRRDHVSS